tara:strand:- start:269 stop:463 length:195 start_codon:yes stop_codon:yes gene_type:complete
MSICKFRVGDLVYRKKGHDKDFWEDRIGTVMCINYVHGDPRIGVKWARIEQIRFYDTKGVEKIE